MLEKNSSSSRSAFVDRRSISSDQPSLPVSRQLCHSLLSLVQPSHGRRQLSQIYTFFSRKAYVFEVCLPGKTFLGSARGLRIDMHVDASIVSELSLCLIQNAVVRAWIGQSLSLSRLFSINHAKNHTKAVLCLDISIVSCWTTLWDVAT